MAKLAVVLFAVLAAAPAAAQSDAELFAGEWKTTDKAHPTGGARIYEDHGRWMLQVLGACTPTACVWHPVPLTVHPVKDLLDGPPRATATSSTYEGLRAIVLTLGEDELRMETEGRGASAGKVVVDHLIRVKRKTEPLPPMVRGPRPPTAAGPGSMGRIGFEPHDLAGMVFKSSRGTTGSLIAPQFGRH